MCCEKWGRRSVFVVWLLAALSDGHPLVIAVDSIGMTVSDLDRSVEFYSKVLSFEKVSETEFDGSDYEQSTSKESLDCECGRHGCAWAMSTLN
jgi:hypothetical protein